MKIAEPELAAKAHWVISTQLIISVFTAAAFLVKGAWESVAALYGGLASLCITILLLWGIKRATEAAKDNPGKSMRILYAGAAQRFLLVLGLLAMGIALFKLDPIAMCTGFALAQLSYLFGSRSKGA
ncbi:MAG: ATP synthase subunit I [Gammaproteobacteria bacterium]|nr:ATP synthase subunit I [Gammaproteobacteria bacterium]